MTEVQADYADRAEIMERWGCALAVDANQAPTYERLLEQSAVRYPNAEIENLAAYAAGVARETVPTAKDAAMAIAEMRLPGYCYLSFCGVEGVAQYMKIGMSTHPEQRLYNMATGSPLDCLWVYTVRLPTRRAAYRAEQTLLKHMAEHKRRGEWVEVGQVRADGAADLARHLSGVLRDAFPNGGEFELLGFRDGRAAA